MSIVPYIEALWPVPSCVNLTTYVQGSSDYEILCQILQKLNEVVHGYNTLDDAVTDLNNKFNSLKEFVDNYFENLDVQNEIDNKLENMLETGELNQIIGVFLFSRVELDNYENLVSDNGWDAALTKAIEDCHTKKVPLHVTPGKTYHFNNAVSVSDIRIFSENIFNFDFKSEYLKSGDAFTISGNSSSIENLQILNTTGFDGFAVKCSYLANNARISNLRVRECNNGIWIERSWYCPIDNIFVFGNSANPAGVGIRLGDSSVVESGVNGISICNVSIQYFNTGLELASNVSTNSTQFSGLNIEHITGSAINASSNGNIGISGLYAEDLRGGSNVLFSNANTYVTLSNVVVRANTGKVSLAPDNSYKILLLDRMYNPGNLDTSVFSSAYNNNLSLTQKMTFTKGLCDATRNFYKDAGESSLSVALNESAYVGSYIATVYIFASSAVTSKTPIAYAVMGYERYHGRLIVLYYQSNYEDDDDPNVTFASNNSTLTLTFKNDFATSGCYVAVNIINPNPNNTTLNLL